jgi:hypothetical protein
MTRLEDAARSLYDNERDDALENYGIASNDYDRQYNMYDTDRKFAFDQDKFDVSQSNWEKEFDYNAEVDNREWNDKQYQDATGSLYSYVYNGYGYDSYEDYVKKTNSPISKQDYEAIVAQATDDRTTYNENKGYTKGQQEAQATIINYIKSGQWGGLSNKIKDQLVRESGMSASYWKSQEAAYGAAGAAAGAATVSPADFAGVMKYAEQIAKQGPDQLYGYLIYQLGDSDLAVDIYNMFYDPDTGKLIYDFDEEE